VEICTICIGHDQNIDQQLI